jgi:hypothetical protein
MLGFSNDERDIDCEDCLIVGIRLSDRRHELLARRTDA